jgi:3-oxoacyl-[acyl-carrier-protein] synthase II
MTDVPAMTAAPDQATGLAARRHRRGTGLAVVTGIAAASAYGRGTAALLSGVLSGQPAFAPVQRFDVTRRRVGVAAAMPGSPDLLTEVTGAVRDACDDAGLSPSQRAGTPLFLAIHGDPAMPRATQADKPLPGPEAFAAAVASGGGLAGQRIRSYMSACVSASSAIADAAALIARDQAERVVVAGGYLVEPDQFALFDAGRVLADDGQVRPFSAGRRGIVLGDGVGAVVIESRQVARMRRAPALIRLAGWGRSGDAYHPCLPHPEGLGLARAVVAALERSGIAAGNLGYVNAHGSGTSHSDPAETNALRLSLGEAAAEIPVSSTKSLHGQALEASGVLELIVTLLAIRKGMLPVNSGFLGADEKCRLSLVLGEALATTAQFAMSLNSAFGGANTALVIGLP